MRGWICLFSVTVGSICPPKVKVTLRLMVGQSVCLGVEPTLGLATRYYFLSEGCWLKVQSCFCGVPSMTRGRDCRLQCDHSLAGVTLHCCMLFAKPCHRNSGDDIVAHMHCYVNVVNKHLQISTLARQTLERTQCFYIVALVG
jgi:hypothetical protein